MSGTLSSFTEVSNEPVAASWPAWGEQKITSIECRRAQYLGTLCVPVLSPSRLKAAVWQPALCAVVNLSVCLQLEAGTE